MVGVNVGNRNALIISYYILKKKLVWAAKWKEEEENPEKNGAHE